MKHGHSTKNRTPTYVSWLKMRERCRSKTCNRVNSYYNKGITYDPRWESFALFLEDMGERLDGTSLDRFDNNKGYSKDNCRWASTFDQMRNTSRNVFYNINGSLHCQSDAVDVLGITIKKLRVMREKNRLPKGVSFVGLLTNQETL